MPRGKKGRGVKYLNVLSRIAILLLIFFKVFVATKIRSLKRSFIIILGLQMILLVVFYEIKNIICNEQILNSGKIILLIMFFVIDLFLLSLLANFFNILNLTLCSFLINTLNELEMDPLPSEKIFFKKVFTDWNR